MYLRIRKKYPLGRIYYGQGIPLELMDAKFKVFLNKKIVQEPFEIDTSWLNVGHVDEVISFVPSPGGKGFKFLDDWSEYHVMNGEVHCGTNTLRAPTMAKWWEFDP